MTWQTDLVSFIQSHPDLTTIQSDRFYPIMLPQEPTLPASTYLLVSSVPQYVHSHEMQFNSMRVQFDYYASTYLVAHQLATAAENALRSFLGPYKVLEENRLDMPEPELDRFRVTVDYRLMEVS